MLKKDRIEKTRALIDRQPYNTDFSELDTVELNALTGWNFKRYQRVANDAFPTDKRCVAHHVDEDGVSGWAIWSWRKAITERCGPDTYQALRSAVRAQLAVYSASAANQCAACEGTEFLTVDHMTVPFKHIADEFIAAHPALTSCIINDASGSGWVIGDPVVWFAWNSFHEDRADYQVLCRSCNSKKGVHHAVRE